MPCDVFAIAWPTTNQFSIDHSTSSTPKLSKQFPGCADRHPHGRFIIAALIKYQRPRLANGGFAGRFRLAFAGLAGPALWGLGGILSIRFKISSRASFRAVDDINKAMIYRGKTMWITSSAWTTAIRGITITERVGVRVDSLLESAGPAPFSQRTGPRIRSRWRSRKPRGPASGSLGKTRRAVCLSAGLA
jgi:hypothetical protein